MRINEYHSLQEFTDEYTGIWSPSDGHWLGLDFKFENTVYRLSTGSMYDSKDTILPDGRTAVFYMYQLIEKTNAGDRGYVLIGEYADMSDLLDLCVINGRKFADIIIDDNTEILGKD